MDFTSMFSSTISSRSDMNEAEDSTKRQNINNLLGLMTGGLITSRATSPPTRDATEHLSDFWQDDFMSNNTADLSSTKRMSVFVNNGATGGDNLAMTANRPLSMSMRRTSVNMSRTSVRSPLLKGDKQLMTTLEESKVAQDTSKASEEDDEGEQPQQQPQQQQQQQEERNGPLLGSRPGDMNLILAICMVYIAGKRSVRKCLQRRREKAAAMGKIVDIALTREETAALERKHYKQFKKLLIQGIKLRQHTLQDARDVIIKVDTTRKNLLIMKNAFAAEKISIMGISEIKRGKVTPVFKKKEKMKGLQASRCFSLVSNDRATELDLEVVPDQNSYKALGRSAEGGAATAASATGGSNTSTNINSQSNNDDGEGGGNNVLMNTQRLLQSLTGGREGEHYLNERKFYVNGFEHLKGELTGAESFWWDPNGSLRKVTLSAFDDQMNIQRQMGILDLDESEAEKKRRLAEEERERLRIKRAEKKVVAQKIREDEKNEKLRKKKEAKEAKERERLEEKLKAKKGHKNGRRTSSMLTIKTDLPAQPTAAATAEEATKLVESSASSTTDATTTAEEAAPSDPLATLAERRRGSSKVVDTDSGEQQARKEGSGRELQKRRPMQEEANRRALGKQESGAKKDAAEGSGLLAAFVPLWNGMFSLSSSVAQTQDGVKKDGHEEDEEESEDEDEDTDGDSEGDELEDQGSEEGDDGGDDEYDEEEEDEEEYSQEGEDYEEDEGEDEVEKEEDISYSRQGRVDQEEEEEDDDEAEDDRTAHRADQDV